jgi:anti-sigma-K factor RskA
VNIKEYISSGVVESYVLGLLTAQEKFEFEQYCEAYPELKAARDAFELAVEKQAMENAVSPPANVKEKVFSAIQQRPVSNTSKIVSMEPTIRRSAGLRWMAAASIILFLVTGYFAYKLYNQNKNLNNSLKSLQVKVDQMEEYHKIMSDPNVAVVNMVAMTPAKASASIYWDSTSSDVYLLIKNMPQLPSDKQYQLWSIMNGENGQLQPSSLGLFDVGENQKIILKMSNVKKADAFAITIEKRGNTEGPNLEQLQSMGKTKIQ